jgi:hypothetical protein
LTSASGPPSAESAGDRPRRRLLIDLEPLRRDLGFRTFWVSQIGSSLARETARVLLPLSAYLITDSALVLGISRSSCPSSCCP